MPNGSTLKPDRAISVLAQTMPFAVRQMINDVRITRRPTSVTIRFTPRVAGLAWVALFPKTGPHPAPDTSPALQVRGGWAEVNGSGRYEKTFTLLDQGTAYWYRIVVHDPRPPGQKDPAGPVTVIGSFTTLKRTASVSFDRLRVYQDGDDDSPGEMTFTTALYDGTGRDRISDQRFYPASGSASIEAQGHRGIVSPFGSPFLLDPAPDRVAIHGSVYEDDRWDFPNPWDDVGIGMKLPDSLPTELRLRKGGSFTTSALQQSFRLSDAEGAQEIPFVLFSHPWEVVFELRGKISSTVVRRFAEIDLQRSPVTPNVIKRSATRLLDARPIFVKGGKTLVTFTLDPDGRAYRLGKKARSMSDVQLIGDVPLRALVAAANEQDLIDLIGVTERGGLLHARFPADDEAAPVWRELPVQLGGEPSVIHATDGWLHLFGLDPNGALMQGSLTPDAGESGSWKRLGEGFTGRVEVAGPVGDSVHLFARRQRKGIAHGLVSLHRGEADVSAWDDLSAPFDGSIMAARLEDGAVVALGWDANDVIWYKAWEKGRVDPAGPDWERLGTSGEIFAAAERHDSAKRFQERRAAPSARQEPGRLQERAPEV